MDANKTPRAQAMADKKAARKASDARIAEARNLTLAVVAANRCPDCGRAVKRNLALTGWYTCTQRGAVGWRADAAMPACDWQGFTA